MDLRHHIRVWFRWKLILIVGFVLAVVLGVFASFQPSTSGKLKWRAEAVYTTKSRLLITQTGFPWGRATLPGSGVVAPDPDSGAVASQFADPSRFSNLAIIYAYIGQSDQVRALIRPLPKPDQISVVWQATGSGDALPLIEITAKGNTAAGAQGLNFKAIDALRGYLREQMDANEVPKKQRVIIQVLNPPLIGKLESGRTPTLSLVAFVLIMVGTLLLVYILENIFPTPVPGKARTALEAIDPEDRQWDEVSPRLDDLEARSYIAGEPAEKVRPGA